MINDAQGVNIVELAVSRQGWLGIWTGLDRLNKGTVEREGLSEVVDQWAVSV